MGDPRWGKLHRCRNNPLAQDKGRQDRLRKLSNLDNLSHCTLQNFNINHAGYSEFAMQSLRMALDIAIRYAQEPRGWLMLEGGYGCGKTHLAAGIGHERLAQGDVVVFLTVPDLLDHLRATYSPQSEVGYDEVFERLRNAALLVLDDLGVENASEWAQEKLYQLLNHRYATKKPTVITTNGFLKKLDPRLASRFSDSNLVSRVTINAPDFRSKLHRQGLVTNTRISLYHRMTLDSFDVHSNLTKEGHDNLAKALNLAKDFADKPQNWLFFVGAHGTGKTHLAAAIAQAVKDRMPEEYRVLFFDVPELMSELRATFDSQSEVRFDALLREIREADVLVLDDIPPESPKLAWTHETLFQILEVRYVSQSPTILTSAARVEQLSARLRSRLQDTRLCHIMALVAPPYAMRSNSKR